MNLRKKLALAIVITGVISAIIISAIAVQATSFLEGEVGKTYEHKAENISEKRDRNLFERYGDAQAFGANQNVNDHASWFQTGAEKNKFANAFNRHIDLYGFYPLSYFVGLDGRLIAVNDLGSTGKAIDTAFSYKNNYNVVSYSPIEDLVGDVYGHFKSASSPEAEITIIDSKGRIIVDYDPSSHGGKAAANSVPNIVLKLNLAKKGVEGAKVAAAGKSGYGPMFIPARGSVK